LSIPSRVSKLGLDREMAKKSEAEAVFQEYTRELQEIELQARDLKDNLVKLTESLDQNSQLNKEKEVQIEQLNKMLEEERLKEQTAGEKVSTHKLDLSSLEQNSQYILENLKRVKRDIEKLYEEEASLKADITKTSQVIQEKEEIIGKTQELIVSLETQISELEEKIRQKSTEREHITSIHKNFFTKRE
jgi:chromosome segregation protein